MNSRMVRIPGWLHVGLWPRFLVHFKSIPACDRIAIAESGPNVLFWGAIKTTHVQSLSQFAFSLYGVYEATVMIN